MLTGLSLASLFFQLVSIVVSVMLWRRTRCAGFLLILGAYVVLWVRRLLGLFIDPSSDRFLLISTEQAWLQIVVSVLMTFGLVNLYHHIVGNHRLMKGSP